MSDPVDFSKFRGSFGPVPPRPPEMPGTSVKVDSIYPPAMHGVVPGEQRSFPWSVQVGPGKSMQARIGFTLNWPGSK